MKLRSTAFGGFNKQDVIAYIEKVKNDAFEEKSRLQKQVKELTDKISDLEGKVTDFEAEKEKLVKHIGELSVSGESKNETVEEINEATNHLKNVADELCQSLRDFMLRISENCCAVVVEGDSDPGEEDFDSSKFMAELEAEIYAKLGVEEESEEEEENEEESAPCAQESEDKAEDKVSSILSSFIDFKPVRVQEEKKEEASKDDAVVSGILDSLSFLK